MVKTKVANILLDTVQVMMTGHLIRSFYTPVPEAKVSPMR
jgi:hypothetical protein